MEPGHEVDLTFNSDRSITASDRGREFLADFEDDLVTWNDTGHFAHYMLLPEKSHDEIIYEAVANNLTVDFADYAARAHQETKIVEVTIGDPAREVTTSEYLRVSHPYSRDFKADWDGVHGAFDLASQAHETNDIYNALRRLGWSIEIIAPDIEVRD